MPPSRSPWSETWRLLRKNRMAFSGLVIFAIFFVIALAGTLLTSGSNPVLDPAQVRLQEKLRPPLSAPIPETVAAGHAPVPGRYLLGTDDLGRDVFARMLQGAWVSLTVGFVAVGISVAIGILLGGLAGYFGQRALQVGHMLFWSLAIAAPILALASKPLSALLAAALAFAGWIFYVWLRRSKSARPPAWLAWLTWPAMGVDALVMRAVDIMLCFPSFFLILTVVALLPPSLYKIMVVIGLTSWMGTTRLVRAEFLSLREQDFVAAARALGLSDLRIILGGAELSGLRRTSTPCHLGQYSFGRQRLYLRCTLADLRAGHRHPGRTAGLQSLRRRLA
ncbi:MAG: ABC transporter permease [Desulfobacterales bacterium]|nr:ABC transporter permease [Desulfobacterales bacterium]